MVIRRTSNVLRWLLIAIGVAMTLALILDATTAVRKNLISRDQNTVYAKSQQPPQDASRF
jgi:hypothetical protein